MKRKKTKVQREFRIVRSDGNFLTERAIQVSKPVTALKQRCRYYWFNPASQLQRTVGRHLGRDFCIVSFLDGLVSSGYSVHVTDALSGRRKPRIFYHHPDLMVTRPEYFLVGLAYGLDKWQKIQSQIWKLPEECRYQAIWATALHFVRQPPEKPIRIIHLIVPGYTTTVPEMRVAL